MYEQNKQEYAKYEPNPGYSPAGYPPPPPAYTPMQPYPYAGYPAYRRRNRRMVVLLAIAALIVAALMFAAIASTAMRGHFGGNAFAQAAPVPLGGMVKACNSNDAKCITIQSLPQPLAPLGKPDAPISKPCDPADSACIANPQAVNPPTLPDGVSCSPCLWTSSPNYQASGALPGDVSGAYHIYDLESLSATTDDAIKKDLAAGWNLNIEVGSHDRALVFTDLGVVCEVNDQCHAIGKLGRIGITSSRLADIGVHPAYLVIWLHHLTLMELHYA